MYVGHAVHHLLADALNDVCTPCNPRKPTQEDILPIYTSLM